MIRRSTRLTAAGLAAGLLMTAVAAGGVPDARKAANAPGFDFDALARRAARSGEVARAWYVATHPADRVTWGGLAAAAALGLGVVCERMFRLRRRRIVPAEFEPRFLERLQDGRLDRGKALDYCELNVSPATRIALSAVKRWGRPTTDLDRAVALAHRVETDRLRRNVGTIRRVAALAPLLGLLGSLFALGRALVVQHESAAAWGPALAEALWPLTAGVVLATVALVLYDGLAGRVEALSGALERIGAETIDAIVMAAPVEPRPSSPLVGSGRTPHQVRLEVPKPGARVRIDDEDEYD